MKNKGFTLIEKNLVAIPLTLDDGQFTWTSLNNAIYKNYDIIDILKLSTFDIKDQSENVYYEKNAELEKLTTNYE